jgi:hypothetical protein
VHRSRSVLSRRELRGRSEDLQGDLYQFQDLRVRHATSAALRRVRYTIHRQNRVYLSSEYCREITGIVFASISRKIDSEELRLQLHYLHQNFEMFLFGNLKPSVSNRLSYHLFPSICTPKQSDRHRLSTPKLEARVLHRREHKPNSQPHSLSPVIAAT